jgi:hypothetical protein
MDTRQTKSRNLKKNNRAVITDPLIKTMKPSSESHVVETYFVLIKKKKKMELLKELLLIMYLYNMKINPFYLSTSSSIESIVH